MSQLVTGDAAQIIKQVEQVYQDLEAQLGELLRRADAAALKGNQEMVTLLHAEGAGLKAAQRKLAALTARYDYESAPAE